MCERAKREEQVVDRAYKVEKYAVLKSSSLTPLLGHLETYIPWFLL